MRHRTRWTTSQVERKRELKVDFEKKQQWRFSKDCDVAVKIDR
jgi:hypothetical protein